MKEISYYTKVLKDFLNFNDRSRRSEFWYFNLINLVISILIGFLEKSIDITFISTIYQFAILLPAIAVIIRRMHDINKSGWYCLIPFYNIYLCCIEGDKGENQYGSDPKALVS